jgi:hypothetical protein
MAWNALAVTARHINSSKTSMMPKWPGIGGLTMERRLIDANALETKFAGPFVQTYKDCREALRNAPTIDAVEVVRCGDCAYMHVPLCCPCQISGFKVPDDWYCPMGVRREPDGE